MPSSARGMEGEASGWTSSPSTARPSPPEKGGTHRVRRLPQEERHQGPRRRNSCLSSGQRDDREGERARVKEAHPSDGRRGGEGTPPEGQAQEEALSGPRGQELRHIPRQAVPPEEAHPCEHTKEEQEEASGETDDFRQACPEEDALHRGTVLQLDEIVQEDRHEVRQACLLVHGVHPHRLQPHPHEGGIEIGSDQVPSLDLLGREKQTNVQRGYTSIFKFKRLDKVARLNILSSPRRQPICVQLHINFRADDSKPNYLPVPTVHESDRQFPSWLSTRDYLVRCLTWGTPRSSES